MGDSEGLTEGAIVGLSVGILEGALVGSRVGLLVGCLVGLRVGFLVGFLVGLLVGFNVTGVPLSVTKLSTLLSKESTILKGHKAVRRPRCLLNG